MGYEFVLIGVVAGFDVDGGCDWGAEGVVQIVFDPVGDVMAFFDAQVWPD